jgi:ParB family chromosome partitioning protein
MKPSIVNHLPIITQLVNIQIERIKPCSYQPRKDFNSEKLNALKNSIKQHGVLEPIIVRPTTINTYEIIAGERRWRAAHLAGLSKIPCQVGDYTQEQVAQISLIENIIREELNPIEQAQGILRLLKEFSYSHSKISNVLSIPRTQITNLLRLLKLDKRVQEMIRGGHLSVAHGKILAGVKSTINQYYLAIECVNKLWSTRTLDSAIKNSRNQNISHQTSLVRNLKKDTNTLNLEKNLSDYIGYNVNIDTNKDNSGNLNIRFHNMDGLQSILEKIGFIK